jgi:hypothetical protein
MRGYCVDFEVSTERIRLRREVAAGVSLADTKVKMLTRMRIVRINLIRRHFYAAPQLSDSNRGHAYTKIRDEHRRESCTLIDSLRLYMSQLMRNRTKPQIGEPISTRSA